MQQIVDTGGNADLTEYAKLSEIIENYYNKKEIDAKLEPLANKKEIANTYYNKTEINDKVLPLISKQEVAEITKDFITETDLEPYALEEEVINKTDMLQPKNDNTLLTTSKRIVPAINEVKTITDNINVELVNKANISSLNDKQNINDTTLETTAKTIVGAINEVNTLAKNSIAPDLSNYYKKNETYNRAETDTKLDTKLNKTVYDTDKNIFQLKQDNSLVTTDKTIVGAINELNNNIGDNNNIFKNSSETSTIGEALELNYFSKSNTYWTGDIFPFNHTGHAGNTDRSYLVLKVNKTNLDNSCNVLKIKSRVNGLSIVGTTSRYAFVSIYVRTGGNFIPPTTFTDYLSQELTASFRVEKSTSPDLSNNNKEFYVFIPEIDKNDIFIDIYASEDSTTILESIEVVQMLNTKPNLLLYNNVLSMPFKVGINSSMYIGGGGLIEKSKGSSLNLSYGNKSLKLAGAIDDKNVSRTLSIGHYTSEKLEEGSSNTFIGIENCRYLETGTYNTILGDNTCSYTHVSASSSNYDYITDMNQCTIIGSYAKPKINSSTNENIIGYNAKGNGTNTFTLGNSNITSLYAQVSSITQFSDLRIKEDIKDIDINEVISNIKGLKVIHASYMDLEEFIGNSENDKHKLMFDGTSYRNSFKNDTRLVDRVFHPIDPVTKKRKVASIQVLDENGEFITKEVDETLTIDDCIEITPSQLLPALVVTAQYFLDEVNAIKETIKQQNNLINGIASRLEVLENN